MAKRKIEIVEAPYKEIKAYLEERKEKEEILKKAKRQVEIRKENQQKCEHNHDHRIGYFTHQGVERKGMYCLDCGLLTDYYPQYNEDDL